ncbi:hypothetical protein HB364_10290 [Pseudoflavitalea sp. X16]|uniref:hypothetical protein n=1 Tax=Paraflavitalea devenefica TaxID=2716334 RepID=UPI00142417A3|nr:hypothetical protein [Paraflavitalea devenefica]NII25472.1 hypothetical protein [Paraflavitalea devenefica]
MYVHDWEYRIKWFKEVSGVGPTDNKPFDILYDIFCLDGYDLYQIHDEIYGILKLALDDENVYEIKSQHRVFVYEMLCDITTAAYLIAKDHFLSNPKNHERSAGKNRSKNRRKFIRKTA